MSSATGFASAAATILILANGPQGPTLYGKGRDIEEMETALRFDRARSLWTALGDATKVRRTDERKAILDALRESCDPLSPTAIITLTGMKAPNVRKLLGKVVKAGEILKAGRGKYSHLDYQLAAKTE